MWGDSPFFLICASTVLSSFEPGAGGGAKQQSSVGQPEAGMLSNTNPHLRLGARLRMDQISGNFFPEQLSIVPAAGTVIDADPYLWHFPVGLVV